MPTDSRYQACCRTSAGAGYNAAVHLTTDNLTLRHWRDSDLADYARFFADEAQVRFIGGTCPDYEAWRRLAVVTGHWTLKGFGLWAVDETETGKFVGCVGVQHPHGWPETELGYWIAADMQRKGYATEAACCARDHAYEALGLDTLVSFIHPDNAPSIRVAERLGAKLERHIELLSFGRHCVYRHHRYPQ